MCVYCLLNSCINDSSIHRGYLLVYKCMITKARLEISPEWTKIYQECHVNMYTLEVFTLHVFFSFPFDLNI